MHPPYHWTIISMLEFSNIISLWPATQQMYIFVYKWFAFQKVYTHTHIHSLYLCYTDFIKQFYITTLLRYNLYFLLSFLILALTFGSMTHFKSMFMYCEEYLPNMWRCCCSSTSCWKDYSFPIEWFRYTHEKSIDDECEGLFMDSWFCPIVLYVSRPILFQYHTVLITVALL